MLGCRNPVSNELCDCIAVTPDCQRQLQNHEPQDHDSWPKSIGEDPPYGGQPISNTSHTSLLPSVIQDLSHVEILNTEEEPDRHMDDYWSAWDDVKGGELPAHLVYLARKRELA